MQGYISLLVIAGAALGITPAAAAVPDLSGTWDNGGGIAFVNPVRDGKSICVSGCGPAPGATPAAGPRSPPPPPDRPKYNAQNIAHAKDLEARQVREDPVLRCLPPGVPRIGPPDKIVQTAREIIFLYEDVSGNFHRIIPVDGRGHRNDVEATYLGDAIGRFEGDTLVVETVNFTEDTWLTDDGAFHTAELKVTERLRRDGDTLHWEAVADDPGVLAQPWALRPRTATLTTSEMVESPPCIEQDLEHMVDDTSHDNPR